MVKPNTERREETVIPSADFDDRDGNVRGLGESDAERQHLVQSAINQGAQWQEVSVNEQGGRFGVRQATRFAITDPSTGQTVLARDRDDANSFSSIANTRNEQDTSVNAAFNEVLGRDADPGGLETFRYLYQRPDELRKLISQSDEALRSGVNPADFGGEALDRNNLTEDQKKFADIWDTYRPGEPLWADRFNMWSQFGQTPEHFAAELKGEILKGASINEDTGQITSYKVYTPAAIETLGGSFNLKGKDAGEVVIVPEGQELDRNDFWSEVHSFGEESPLAGYKVYGALGSFRGGVLGKIADDTGINEFTDLRDKWIPHELWGAIDLMGGGNSAKILGGGYADTYAIESMEDAGWSSYEKDRALVGSIAVTIAAGIGCGMFTAGTASASCMAAAQSAHQVATAAGQDLSYGGADWTDVAIGVAANFATVGISAGAAGAFQSAGLSAAQSQVAASVLTGAVRAGESSLRGGDTEDALLAFTGSVVGDMGGAEMAAVYEGVATGVRTDWDWSDVAIASLGTYAGDLSGQRYAWGTEALLTGISAALVDNDQTRARLLSKTASAVSQGRHAKGSAFGLDKEPGDINHSFLFGEDKGKVRGGLFREDKLAHKYQAPESWEEFKEIMSEDAVKGAIQGLKAGFFPGSQLDWSDDNVRLLLALTALAPATGKLFDSDGETVSFDAASVQQDPEQQARLNTIVARRQEVARQAPQRTSGAALSRAAFSDFN